VRLAFWQPDVLTSGGASSQIFNYRTNLLTSSGATSPIYATPTLSRQHDICRASLYNEDTRNHVTLIRQ
jgi:hypothetical protein